MKILILVAAMAVARAESNDELAGQVRRTELAFAKTMADRDHQAFATFVAEEAVFLGQKSALRGKAQVAAGWKALFEGKEAPFAWAPERVAVLDSGTLAISTGPVTGKDGKRVGTFTSVWRREKTGEWKIVMDNGCDCGGK